MRAQAHSRLGNSPAAIADYSCFLALAGPNDERRAEALIGRALNHEQLQRYDGALDELEQLFTRHPDCGRWDYRVAAHCNVVAWHYAKSANGDLQTPGSSLASRVLELARKAVRIEPFNLDYQNTLGVVLYRLGHYQEAVDCLEHNLAAQPDNAAHDLYFLAMSYERLSRSEKARDCFHRANSWWQARPNLSSEHAAELAAFRAEAAALLGLPISIESR
jgi:tetratricopeptide (TPR) repeat protein